MQQSPERNGVPLGFSMPDLNNIFSQLHSDHTQMQRSVYSAQMVTEDPDAAHLSVYLTVALASAKATHTHHQHTF